MRFEYDTDGSFIVVMHPEEFEEITKVWPLQDFQETLEQVRRNGKRSEVERPILPYRRKKHKTRGKG